MMYKCTVLFILSSQDNSGQTFIYILDSMSYVTIVCHFNRMIILLFRKSKIYFFNQKTEVVVHVLLSGDMAFRVTWHFRWHVLFTITRDILFGSWRVTITYSATKCSESCHITQKLWYVNYELLSAQLVSLK